MTSQRIVELASNLEQRLANSVAHFTRLNVETKFVALNARIEAGRSGGQSGRAFDVVAQAIQDISGRTGQVAENLSDEFRDLLREMREITDALTVDSRGERLGNLALANIDLIDRNLYERSCDVRWWATDASVVDALENPAAETLLHAARRMGQILDSYTVYFDIIVADLKGRVLANGNPNQFPSSGMDVSKEPWFASTLRTFDGTKYVQSDVGKSVLCSDQRAIIFACTVRSNGKANGCPLGVLAVVFRWDALAQTIVERTPLTDNEWDHTRVCIADSNGRVLADSDHEFGAKLGLQKWGEIVSSDRSYCMTPVDGVPHCVGYAHSPGYETYGTGWYSLLLQSNEGV